MLRLRRLLVVNQAPRQIEDLLREKPGDEPTEDAERDEQELAHGYASFGWPDGWVRGSIAIVFSSGTPLASSRPRSISAFISAPSSTAMLEIHSQIKKTMTPARLPYVALYEEKLDT